MEGAQSARTPAPREPDPVPATNLAILPEGRHGPPGRRLLTHATLESEVPGRVAWLGTSSPARAELVAGGRLESAMPKPKLTSASLRNAFRQIIWPRRKLLGLGLVLILINRVSALVLPATTKVLIDDVIAAGRGERLWPIIGAVGVAVAVQAATSFSLTRLLSVEAQRLIAELRSQVQRHVLRLPVRHFEETKSGELVSRIMNDVEGVRNLVGTGLVQLVGGDVDGLARAGLPAAHRSSADGAGDGAADLLRLRLHAGLRQAASGLSRARQDPGRGHRALDRSLGWHSCHQGFHALEREGSVFRAGVLRLFDNVKTTLTTTAAVTSLGSFFVGLASVIILGYGGRQILQGDLTIGQLFSFTVFLAFLVGPIVQMANIGTQMTEAFAGLDRTAELLSLPGEDDDPRRGTKMPPIEGRVAFEGVTFSYVEGEQVLKDISFEVPAGCVVALVGSSGSGKSTLAALAMSFLEPDKVACWWME